MQFVRTFVSFSDSSNITNLLKRTLLLVEFSVRLMLRSCAIFQFTATFTACPKKSGPQYTNEYGLFVEWGYNIHRKFQSA